MSDKLKLLETANRKAASDRGFIAYCLLKYSEIEQKTEQEIISSLNCQLEDYYKLGLCRTPDVNSNDFLLRLNNISSYTHVSAIELNKIIKRVNAVLKFSDANTQVENSYLMAARDKKKKDK
jgi:hypothetical protein